VSWQQLGDIAREAAAEREAERSRPPVACPRCGEPLEPGPPGSSAELHCRFDGFQFPRDWHPLP
jgi:hypothetical protein